MSALGHPRSPSGIGRGVRLALTRLKRAPGALKCSQLLIRRLAALPGLRGGHPRHMRPRSGAGVSSGTPSVALGYRARRPSRFNRPQKAARSAIICCGCGALCVGALCVFIKSSNARPFEQIDKQIDNQLEDMTLVQTFGLTQSRRLPIACPLLVKCTPLKQIDEQIDNQLKTLQMGRIGLSTKSN